MNMLWYIVHSFDVMEKTKYMQVYAESLLIFFFYIFCYSEIYIVLTALCSTAAPPIAC